MSASCFSRFVLGKCPIPTSRGQKHYQFAYKKSGLNSVKQNISLILLQHCNFLCLFKHTWAKRGTAKSSEPMSMQDFKDSSSPNFTWIDSISLSLSGYSSFEYDTILYFSRLSSFKGKKQKHTTKNLKHSLFSHTMLRLTSLSSHSQDRQAVGFLGSFQVWT